MNRGWIGVALVVAGCGGVAPQGSDEEAAPLECGPGDELACFPENDPDGAIVWKTVCCRPPDIGKRCTARGPQGCP